MKISPLRPVVKEAEMLRTIVKKEVLHSIFENRLTVVFSVCMVLFSASASVRLHDYRRRLDVYSISSQESSLERPEELSILVRGLDGIEREYQPPNPLFQVFIPIDYSYIVEVVLSLMAVLMASGLITGEKERGTLRLMLSNPVPRHAVLLGKWLSSSAILIVSFLVSSITYVLYVGSAKAVAFSGEDYTRIVLIWLVSALYLGCFLNLGLFISTRTHRSSTATVLALIAWIVLVFLIPNLSPLVGKGLTHPISDQTLEQRRVRTIQHEIRPKRIKKVISVKEYYDRINELKRRLDEIYRNSQERFVDLTKRIARFSPASSFMFAVTTLAKTGLEDKGAYKSLYPREEKSRTQISLSTSLNRALLDIAIIAIFNFLFFLAAYSSFLRYDVR